MDAIQELLKVFLSEYGVSLTGMIALVTLVTGWINNAVNINTGKVIWKIFTVGHLVSWAVALLASFVIWFVGAPTSMFVGLDALTVALYGFIIGLGSNAFFSLELVQSILDVLKGLSPTQKEGRSVGKIS
jgi:hypothetical protein